MQLDELISKLVKLSREGYDRMEVFYYDKDGSRAIVELDDIKIITNDDNDELYIEIR